MAGGSVELLPAAPFREGLIAPGESSLGTEPTPYLIFRLP